MAEHMVNPIHLYRALLRESTYLPDVQARRYTWFHIRESFRRYTIKETIPLSRQLSRLQQGRKSLSTLRRANQGYLKPLQYVLFCTYGRKGRRRRELLGQIIKANPRPAIEAGPDSITAALSPISTEAGIQSVSEEWNRDWRPHSMITVLLRGQSRQGDRLDRILAGKKALQVEPTIPERNTWGRPMPENRVRNMIREWYMKQMDRLLPPLPDEEYERLQALAVGQVGPQDRPQPRRKTAVSAVATSAKLGTDPTVHVQNHIASDLSSNNKSNPDLDSLLTPNLLLQGPSKSHTFETYISGRPHNLTPRFLQRIWSTIYRHTPRLIWNPDKDEWSVRWGINQAGHTAIPRLTEKEVKIWFGNG